MSPLSAGGVMKMQSWVWSSHGAGGGERGHRCHCMGSHRLKTTRTERWDAPSPATAQLPKFSLTKTKGVKKPPFQESPRCFLCKSEKEGKRKTKCHFPTGTVNRRA